MANEIEEANALTRQALELAGREQDMLERAHPSADTHEFESIYPTGMLPNGDGWFFLTQGQGCTIWARKKERQENGK